MWSMWLLVSAMVVLLLRLSLLWLSVCDVVGVVCVIDVVIGCCVGD